MQTITLDKPRTVRLTAGAFRRFQASAKEGGDLAAIVKLVHDTLRLDDPSLTEEALEDLLDADAMRTVWQAIQQEMEAFAGALNPTTASEAPASTGNVN